MSIKHRILICGDAPWLFTGFGYLHRNIGEILERDGHVVASIGYADPRTDGDGNIFNNINIPWKVYGCRENPIAFAKNKYKFIVEEFKPTLVLMVTDLYFAERYVVPGIPNIFYAHIEGEPLPTTMPSYDLHQSFSWPDAFLKFSHVISAGAFTKKTIEKRIKEYISKVDTKTQDLILKKFEQIIPNGIDSTIFYNLDKKNELKQQFFHVGADVFVVGYFGRQNPRKNIPHIIEAFAKWDNPKSRLYLHTPLQDSHGWNLIDLVRDFKIEHKVIFNPALTVGGGCSDVELNKRYNACNCSILVSSGEGFGRTACTVKDTLVKTNLGYKPIQDIKKGELVLTHQGRFKPVVDIMSMPYKGKLTKIWADVGPSFVVTSNERVYIRHKQQIRFPAGNFASVFGKLAKDAKKGDKLIYPVIYKHRNFEKNVKAFLNNTISLNDHKYKTHMSFPDLKQAIQYRDLMYTFKHKQMVYIYEESDGTFTLRITKIKMPQRSTKINTQRQTRKIDHNIARTRTYKYDGEVWNIQVADDETYVVNGVGCSHNCESLSCEVPVIVMDYSELSNYGDGTVKIKPLAFHVESRTNIRRAIPSIDDIVAQFQNLHNKFARTHTEMSLQDMGGAGRKSVLKFDWTNIAPMWMSLVNSIPVKENI